MSISQTVAGCVLVLASTSLTGAQPVPAGSESTHDPRWQPWLGCWELVEETRRDESRGAPSGFPADATSEESLVGAVRVCVTPAAGDGGVRMITSTDAQHSNEDVIVADGSARSIARDGCQGTQRAEWSRDGARLFGRAVLTCSEEKPHIVSHLATLHRDFWLDILSVTRDGREGIRVRRYRRAADSGEQRATTPVASAFTIEDVKEASAKVTPLVVQAALVETNASFPLDGHALRELDKAGVSDDVTDLMVALSFPETFKVDRLRTSHGGGSYGEFDPWGYAPFMYSYWGIVDPFGYPDFIVVDGGGDPGQQPAERGRVVNGRGYTRIESREAGSSAAGNGRGTAASTTGSSSADSGGSVSSGGYSSGSGADSGSSGGGGDSGRTAVPR